MGHFSHRDGILYAEDVALPDVAEQYGTPCYVYSRAAIEAAWRGLDRAFAGTHHLICYAVKANSNIALLDLVARLGSGFDIVSGGELERVLAAGADPGRVVFSGVGKSVTEVRRALEAGIRCYNVESEPELLRIQDIAGELGARAPVALRINPDIEAGSHPYISTGLKENKFGIDIQEARALYRRAADLPNIDVTGVDVHIGSQLTSTVPFTDALRRVLSLVDALAEDDIALRHIDIGGGLGIRYKDENPPSPAEYAAAVKALLQGYALQVILEPGRAIVGNAGVFLTRIEYLKHSSHKDFAIVDGAMNDLLRPALYDAWQEVTPVARSTDAQARVYDVVGPVCETADFLAKNRELAVHAGDLLAVRSAGAYGFSMSSNYNSRPRPAEVLVDRDKAYLIRRRERLDELMAAEQRLPADS